MAADGDAQCKRKDYRPSVRANRHRTLLGQNRGHRYRRDGLFSRYWQRQADGRTNFCRGKVTLTRRAHAQSTIAQKRCGLCYERDVVRRRVAASVREEPRDRLRYHQ
jgi:hypothetical protein